MEEAVFVSLFVVVVRHEYPIGCIRISHGVPRGK